MNVPKYWHFARLTASQTPIFWPQETIHQLFDNVGLYQGDYKITTRQNGRLYLTSERVIYIDNVDPVNESVYVRLLDIAALSFYSGFLRSSPKITVLFKSSPNETHSTAAERDNNGEGPVRRDSVPNEDHTPQPASHLGSLSNSASASQTSLSDGKDSSALETELMSVTWKCKVCSYANKISSKHYNFHTMANPDLNSAVKFPQCSNCGIPASKNLVVNAIKKANAKRLKLQEKERKIIEDKKSNLIDLDSSEIIQKKTDTGTAINQCPVCTFANHPAMTNCEICGSNLPNSSNAGSSSKKTNNRTETNELGEVVIINTEDNSNKEAFKQTFVKFSFRYVSNFNDLKKFLHKFQELIDEARLNDMLARSSNNRKVQKIIMPGQSDIDHDPPTAATSNTTRTNNKPQNSKIKTGLSALEKDQGHIIRKNEQLLGSSLEDLNSLMSQAAELTKLIKSFDKVLHATGESSSRYSETLAQSRNVLGLADARSDVLDYIVLSNNLNFLNKLNNRDVFHRELARNLSIFILNYVFKSNNDSQLAQPGQEQQEPQLEQSPLALPSAAASSNEYSGGMITLTDLYSLYNRSLGFNNNLIAPQDLLEAVSLFEALKLPLKFRKFAKSGIMLIQDAKANDEEILNAVVELLVEKKFQLQKGDDVTVSEGQQNEEKEEGKEEEIDSGEENGRLYAETNYSESVDRGMNIQTLVAHFNLSIGILKEILDIGLTNGSLLIDENISGSNYYLNEIVDYEWTV